MIVKIFADGADIASIKELAEDPNIKGFTTNPTLMRLAGVDDYEAFAREVLKIVTDRPVSFEVFADELDEMEKQAIAIASWGTNVNIKIPITNTKGVSTCPIVTSLSDKGISLNVTAIFTLEQVQDVVDALNPNVPAIVSVFAGRIADAGHDPVPHMAKCVEMLKSKPKAELLWASPREILNLVQANQVGCHIITMTPDLIAKAANRGKDLAEFSLSTVEMFYNDACSAGYKINT